MRSSFQSPGFGKIVVSSAAIVATSISSEIPIEKSHVWIVRRGTKNGLLWAVAMVEIDRSLSVTMSLEIESKALTLVSGAVGFRQSLT